MRNLIFILTLILFVSCETEPENVPPYGIEFNPPIWLQGKWRTDYIVNDNQEKSDYWEILENDLCEITLLSMSDISRTCLSRRADFYAFKPNVTETVTPAEYLVEIRNQTNTSGIYNRFVKLTDSTIHYFPYTTGAFNRIYYRVDTIPQ